MGLLSRSGAAEEPVIVAAGGTQLSEKQNAVLNLLAQGASNKAIAQALRLSPGAVKAHVASLLRIYRAENRTDLVMRANKRLKPGAE